MTKKYLSFIFVFLFSLMIAEASAQKYNVNFKNVPMKDFITFVSEFTGKNVIFDEANIRGNVTVNAQKQMDSKEILDIFYSVLKLNGYTPIVSGNNIQIVPEKDIPLLDEKMVMDSAKQKTESFITTVIPLEFYSAATLLPILNRIKSRTGYVDVVRGLNILVARDQSSRIAKMAELVGRVDKEADLYKFHTITLEFAVASKVEQQIIKLYGEMGKNALSTTVPIVVSDDLSNTLIVAATEKEFEKIAFLVKTFDSRTNAANNAPKVFYLKNAKAEDVEKVLNKLINSISPTAGTPGSAPQNLAVRTSSGNNKTNISSDKATNSIIVIGDPDIYSSISDLIEKMDIPRRQVYVEALILETTIDKGTQFGVEWYAGGANGQGAILGGLTGSGALGGLVNSATQGSGNLSLPSGFSLGVIGDIITYQGLRFPTIGALVTALKSSSGVSIVSNPQILTLDNEEAEVFVGENRPYVTSEKFDSNNNPIQTFDYRNVGVRLKITPQISSNNMVTLAIDQEVNKISPATFNASAPVTLTRTTKTTVKLLDKSIIVISGMIKDDSSLTVSGIPFLSAIPVLGWLFKKQDTTIEKTNMMIFITTQIIDTVDESEKLLEARGKAMNKFNRDGDKLLNSKVFSKKKSNIELKTEIETRTDNDNAAAAPEKPASVKDKLKSEIDATAQPGESGIKEKTTLEKDNASGAGGTLEEPKKNTEEGAQTGKGYPYRAQAPAEETLPSQNKEDAETITEGRSLTPEDKPDEIKVEEIPVQEERMPPEENAATPSNGQTDNTEEAGNLQNNGNDMENPAAENQNAIPENGNKTNSDTNTGGMPTDGLEYGPMEMMAPYAR